MIDNFFEIDVVFAYTQFGMDLSIPAPANRAARFETFLQIC